MKQLLSLLFILILLAGCSQQSGRVVSIADGDTFTILGDGNTQVKIRLYGIDCPEKKQDFGTVARQFTADKIFGKVVTIEEKDKDRYGRTVAVVHLSDGTILNEELLKAGLAWHYTAYDDNPHWSQLEATARQNHIGLWQMDEPTPPWAFRKQKRKKSSKPKRTIPVAIEA